MAIITFGGHIGSGKTTAAPRIAEAFGYEEISMGTMFREMAREKGMSIEDFHALLEESPEMEKSVDALQIAAMREKENIVIQGRISFFFAKQVQKPSINIFMTVDPVVAAKRRVDEGSYPGKTVEEVVALHAMREQGERDRYKTLYGIENHLDPALFDIVLDTTDYTPDEAFAILVMKIKERL